MNMNSQMKAELLKRFSGAKHAEHMQRTLEAMFGLGAALENEVARAGRDPTLSEHGRSVAIAAAAKSMVADMAVASKQIRSTESFLVGRRAQLRPPQPDQGDIAAVIMRSEERSAIRALPLRERYAAATRHVDAGLSADADLSGLPADRHAMLKDHYIQQNFARELAEINAVEADNGVVKDAYNVLCGNLLKASQMNKLAFEKLVADAIAAVDTPKNDRPAIDDDAA